MRFRIALLFIFLGTSLSICQAQPPDPLKLAAFEQKADFQVKKLAFSSEDSIYQIVRSAERRACIRLFANEVSVMEGRGAQAEQFTQYGFFLENGKRYELPRGEYFFGFQHGKVFTENYRETADGDFRFINLKRYMFLNQKLRQEASRYDTLKHELSPKWYYWDGNYVLSPAAKDIFIQDSSFFMVRKSDHPRDILLWFIDGRSGVATLNKLVRLGTRQWTQAFQPSAFGLEEVYAAREYCVVHSLYKKDKGGVGNLFSAFDKAGNLLWESTKGDYLIRASQEQAEVLMIHKDPLLFHQIRCLDAQSGKPNWECAIYEQYHNDPKLEFDVINSDEVELAEVYPITGGEFVAVVVHQKKPSARIGNSPILYVINRLGKVVFRYEIEQAATHYRIQEEGENFHLLTENATYLFRRK